MSNKSVDMSKVAFRSVEEVKPYPENPRVITSEAVEAVKESLERFGWQQPIVVDNDGFIVVGHTRFTAALELGLTEVPVRVMEGTAEQVNAYRIADNRTSEFARWDEKKLAIELREFDEAMLESYFPEVDLDLEIEQIQAGLAEVTQEEVDRAEEHISTVPEKSAMSRHTTDVECPACLDHFQVQTKTLPGVTEKLMGELTSD